MTGNPKVALWQGAFGDEYTHRNDVLEQRIADRMAMWRPILRAIGDDPPKSILEVGANVGLNLRALGRLVPAELYALEPNALARQRLVDDKVVPPARAMAGSGEAIPLADRSVDLVFTCGVLIHVPPEALAATCRDIHRVAARFVLAIEYFSDEPVEKLYRGETGALFKRDFGGFWLDQHPGLELLDYGFFWKRATNLDNLTWWLFRKP
jgi:pseudaminic acid biosynthesis-associated methylase